MCVSVLPAGMYMHCMNAWCLQRQEQGVRFSGTGITEGFKSPGGCRTTPQSLKRAESALNYWDISSAPRLSLLIDIYTTIFYCTCLFPLNYNSLDFNHVYRHKMVIGGFSLKVYMRTQFCLTEHEPQINSYWEQSFWPGEQGGIGSVLE